MAQPSASVAWHEKPEQVIVEVTHSVFGYIDQGSCAPYLGLYDLTEFDKKNPDQRWPLSDIKEIPAGRFPAINIVCNAPGLSRIPNGLGRVLEAFKKTYHNNKPKRNAVLIMSAQISESCFVAQFYLLDHSETKLKTFLNGANRIMKQRSYNVPYKDLSQESSKRQLMARKILFATVNFPSSATDDAPAFACSMAYGSQRRLQYIPEDEERLRDKKSKLEAEQPGSYAVMIRVTDSDDAFTPLQYEESGRAWSQDAYFPPALRKENPAMIIYCKFSQMAAAGSSAEALFSGVHQQVCNKYDVHKVEVVYVRDLMPGNILCILLTSKRVDIGEMVKMANAIHALSSPAMIPPAYAVKAYDNWMVYQHNRLLYESLLPGALSVSLFRYKEQKKLHDYILQSAQSFQRADLSDHVVPPTLALYGFIDQVQKLKARKYIVPDSVLSMQHASEKPEHDAWMSLAQSVPASKYPTIVFAFSIQADDVEELVQKQDKLQEFCVKAIADDAPEERMFRATQSSTSLTSGCSKSAIMVMICSRKKGANIARSFFENAAKIMRGEMPVTF